MQRAMRLCGGAILIALSGIGLWQAVRAEYAQVLYYRAKFGVGKATSPADTEAQCRAADGLYRWNYYFCIWTAEKAWYAHFRASGAERETLLAIAGLWCDRGLALNPYRRQLRLLKTRLLRVTSVEQAIRYWETYVDWQFWEPQNHAVLVDLYCEAGQIEKAAQSLKWVEGSPHYAQARARFQEAWSRLRQPPLP